MKFITYIFLGIFTAYVITPLIVQFVKKSKNSELFVIVGEENTTNNSGDIMQDLLIKQVGYTKTYKPAIPAIIPDHYIYISDFSVVLEPVFPPPRFTT